MFTNLRIKNFKAWGEQLWTDGVELAPITLFLGTNSAGKTSILQPLLLLQQTFLSPDRNLDLYFGGKKGDILDLGTYEQIIHGHEAKRELGFGLRLAGVERTEFAPPEGDLADPSTQIETLVGPLEYEVTYGHAGGAHHLKQLVLSHAGLTVRATRSSKGAYSISAEHDYDPAAGKARQPSKREYKPENSSHLPLAARQALRETRLGIDDMSWALRDRVEAVQYLGPLRERPQTTYLWGGQEPGQIGARGEDAIAALLANLNVSKRAERGTLVREVGRWLREMGVADELTLEQVGKSRFYEVMLRTAGKEANLMHVGFGVSQVLPMIVLALTAPEGATIIAEQPEIHLHPRAQAVLANLLVEAAKSRRLQFLIETHSEHLFRRLQFLIADEQLWADDCRLYFVDREQGGEPRLDALAVDPYGRVKNWPKHFFGDALGETERHIEQVFKRLNEEGSDAW